MLTRLARPVGAALALGVLVVATSVSASAEPGVSGPHYLPATVGSTAIDAVSYGAVTCVSSGDCTAVGPTDDAGVTGPVQTIQTGDATVVTESTGVWGPATGISLPANATSTDDGGYSVLDAVACWSVGNCVAVGAYAVTVDVGGTNEPIPQPMAVDEVSGVWGPAQQLDLPPSSDVEGGELYAVSCDSSGNCTAVGYYIALDPSTLAETSDAFATTRASGATTWSTVSDLPVPSSYELIITPAVSCSAANACQAIELTIAGSEATSETAYVVTETDGTWSSPVAVPHLGPDRFVYRSLSCPSAGDCVASGYGSTSAAQLLSPTDFPAWLAIDTETDGTWAPPRILAQPFISPQTNKGILNSISCLSLSSCVAVGVGLETADDEITVPLVASEVDGVWSTNLDESHFTIGHSASATSLMASVTCLSGAKCLAIGDAFPASDGEPVPSAAFWTSVSSSEPLTVPGKPSAVVVVAEGAVTKVTFAPPSTDGGSRISLFAVSATSPHEVTRTCTTAGLSCTFKGAVKGKTYMVTVTARNVTGTSRPSPARTFVAG